VSIPAGIALVDAGHRAAAYVGTAIFAVSLSAVYGTSAAYHLRSWFALCTFVPPSAQGNERQAHGTGAGSSRLPK
jgi:hypothetical protein